MSILIYTLCLFRGFFQTLIIVSKLVHVLYLCGPFCYGALKLGSIYLVYSSFWFSLTLFHIYLIIIVIPVME